MDLQNLSSPVIENTLAALIGAMILSVVTWSIRRFKDKVAERKYSLAGQYKTYYEETRGGEIVSEPGFMNLRQKGLKIIADDREKNGDKGWTFYGNIDSTTGRIYGHYMANSCADAGLGVCILEQKGDGVLDGMWAGYDSATQAIEHGRYVLVRLLDIKIRAATTSDILIVLQLLDQELGEGWLDADDLKQSIADDMLYVAQHEDRVVGFTLLRMMEPGSFEKELYGNAYEVPRDIRIIENEGTLGLLKIMVTDPNYQRKGIGSKLTQKALDVLQEKGAHMVVSFGWKTEEVHIGPALLNAGFKLRHEFENFWHENSIQDNYACPNCGTPCKCGAVLFTKALNPHYKK